MSEKVKLPREVAEAIETMRKEGTKDIDIIRDHFDEGRWVRFKQLNGLDPDILIRALYIGYEVEQSPEDKVREYYLELKEKVQTNIPPNTNSYESFETHEMVGICMTLKLLGIKIEGVNA